MAAEAKRRTVGVLGGMGPEATLDFFARVLAATPAERDQDHLHLLIDNRPQVPNRNDAVAGSGPSPAPLLAEMARGLEAAGAELLVMPCNAAHAFADAIRAAVRIPFLDMIEATTEVTLERVPDLDTVGVLAAAGALDASLYQDAFRRRGVQAVVPEGARRERFMGLLYAIKRGEKGPAVREAMAELAAELVADGAQAIVAGCTEVPLVLAASEVAVPLVSSTDVLVAATIAAATVDPTEDSAGDADARDAMRPNP